MTLQTESSFGVAIGNESEPRTMPIEFKIVGEHLEDPAHLLVLGADGAYTTMIRPVNGWRQRSRIHSWLLLPVFNDATE